MKTLKKFNVSYKSSRIKFNKWIYKLQKIVNKKYDNENSKYQASPFQLLS